MRPELQPPASFLVRWIALASNTEFGSGRIGRRATRICSTLSPQLIPKLTAELDLFQQVRYLRKIEFQFLVLPLFFFLFSLPTVQRFNRSTLQLKGQKRRK